MLETMILRSLGGMTDRIRLSSLRDLLFGIDQPGSRRRFDVDDELAGVGLREEGKSEERKEQQAGAEADDKHRHGQHRDRQQPKHDAVVDPQQRVEAALEPVR